jgi:hypothetical protein
MIITAFDIQAKRTQPDGKMSDNHFVSRETKLSYGKVHTGVLIKSVPIGF